MPTALSKIGQPTTDYRLSLQKSNYFSLQVLKFKINKIERSKKFILTQFSDEEHWRKSKERVNFSLLIQENVWHSMDIETIHQSDQYWFSALMV